HWEAPRTYGGQGIGRPPGRMEAKVYVLQKFSDREREEVDVAIERAVDAVRLVAAEGMDKAVSTWNLPRRAVRQRQQRGAADLGKGEMLLNCYTDASFNSVKADGTSIGGYVCLFGGGAVSWRSKKQNEVGLSSCETEYMALHHGAKEVVWLRRLLEEIGVC
ncbi:unnamed protein product, partial [Closterium sp. NIES-54]